MARFGPQAAPTDWGHGSTTYPRSRWKELELFRLYGVVATIHVVLHAPPFRISGIIKISRLHLAENVIFVGKRSQSVPNCYAPFHFNRFHPSSFKPYT